MATILALQTTFDAARSWPEPQPRVIICDIRMGKGVPFLKAGEKNHLIRVDADECDKALTALEQRV